MLDFSPNLVSCAINLVVVVLLQREGERERLLERTEETGGDQVVVGVRDSRDPPAHHISTHYDQLSPSSHTNRRHDISRLPRQSEGQTRITHDQIRLDLMVHLAEGRGWGVVSRNKI